MGWTQVFAQRDSSDLLIPLDRPQPTAIGVLPTQQAFYRDQQLLRLMLRHPRNRPLRHTDRYPPEAIPTGLVAHLIAGLRDSQVVALHPGQPDRAFRYFDLILRLAQLQNLPDSAYTDLQPADLAWQHLDIEIEIMGQRRMDRSGRSHFEILYLGLLWFPTRPEQEQRVLMAWIPFAQAREWLDQLQCQWTSPDGRLTGTTATRYLEGQLFFSYPLTETRDLPQVFDP